MACLPRLSLPSYPYRIIQRLNHQQPSRLLVDKEKRGAGRNGLIVLPKLHSDLYWGPLVGWCITSISA